MGYGKDEMESKLRRSKGSVEEGEVALKRTTTPRTRIRYRQGVIMLSAS